MASSSLLILKTPHFTIGIFREITKPADLTIMTHFESVVWTNAQIFFIWIILIGRYFIYNSGLQHIHTCSETVQHKNGLIIKMIIYQWVTVIDDVRIKGLWKQAYRGNRKKMDFLSPYRKIIFKTIQLNASTFLYLFRIANVKKRCLIFNTHYFHCNWSWLKKIKPNTPHSDLQERSKKTAVNKIFFQLKDF